MSDGCGKVDQLGHGMAAECGKEAFGRVYLCEFCQGVRKGSDLVKMDLGTVQSKSLIATKYHDRLVDALWDMYEIAHHDLWAYNQDARNQAISEARILLAALEAEKGGEL